MVSVKTPAIAASLRALLSRIIDYAGLFPPAGLDMSTAVANYARYLAGPDRWMLGRFVVPATRLQELEQAKAAIAPGSSAWQLSVLRGSEAADTRLLSEFAERVARSSSVAIADAVELRVTDASSIARLMRQVPDGVTTYFELPLDGELGALVAAVGAAGGRAKIRTGGVTADSLPPARAVAGFIRACVDRDVRFKATAGLHHPLRADYALTYAPDSPRGTMHGFLNVFLATALARAGASESALVALLEESDLEAFRVSSGAITWHDHRLDERALLAAREQAVSFGSCSFEEPVADLRSLGLL